MEKIGGDQIGQQALLFDSDPYISAAIILRRMISEQGGIYLVPVGLGELDDQEAA